MFGAGGCKQQATYPRAVGARASAKSNSGEVLHVGGWWRRDSTVQYSRQREVKYIALFEEA